jgi:uncharacterized phiE125 gp8 family phage protein
MILIEQTTVPTLALPIAAFKTHLRLGTGFADDALQDGLLESTLRAAISMIEGRIGKALIARRFKWTIEDWRNGSEQALPVAPVTAVVSVTLVDAADVSTVVAASLYKLVQDTHRPKLVSAGLALPLVPMAGRAEVVFDAGFGPAWAAVPADLAQAVLLLAAEYYEHRSDSGVRDGGLPFGVVTLIERWRTVRVLGGGTA